MCTEVTRVPLPSASRSFGNRGFRLDRRHADVEAAIAPGLGRRDHSLQGDDAVGEVGVRVQVAADADDADEVFLPNGGGIPSFPPPPGRGHAGAGIARDVGGKHRLDVVLSGVGRQRAQGVAQQRRDFLVGRRHRLTAPLRTGASGKGPGYRSSARRRFRHRGDRRQQVARRRRRGSIRRMARFGRSGRVASPGKGPSRDREG